MLPTFAFVFLMNALPNGMQYSIIFLQTSKKYLLSFKRGLRYAVGMQKWPTFLGENSIIKALLGLPSGLWVVLTKIANGSMKNPSEIGKND